MMSLCGKESARGRVGPISGDIYSTGLGSPIKLAGCASIRAKALSRTKMSWAVCEHRLGCQRG